MQFNIDINSFNAFFFKDCRRLFDFDAQIVAIRMRIDTICNSGKLPSRVFIFLLQAFEISQVAATCYKIETCSFQTFLLHLPFENRSCN